MAEAGIRRLHPRGTSAAAPVLLLLLLAGCAPHWPTEGRPEPGGGAEEPESLDGSADGAADPAGLAEILADVLAEGLADAPGVAGEEAQPAPALEVELRAQFGSVFVDGEGALPDFVVDEVARFIGLFHAGRASDNYRRWLGREGRYRDLILAELRAAALPEELLYLAMLESGFDPVAVSRAKAVGLWQFMRTTGRESGLRIDDWVDERRDPIAATRAAIGHLRVLHRELGDWALAAAAYNAGLGRVRRARDRVDPRAGYFDLVAAGALPAETRSYVPLILAAGHVARHRDRYGLGDVRPEPPLAFDTIRVQGRTRLSAVAATAGVPLDRLRALNAHLLRGAAPPGRGGYAIRVPAGTDVADLPARLGALAVGDRLLPEYRETTWTVRPGDSWWKIARAHGTTVNALRALNPRVGEIIHPGARLVVARRAVFDDEPAGPAGRAAPGPAAEAARATAPTSTEAAGGVAASAGVGAVAGIGAVAGVAPTSGDSAAGSPPAGADSVYVVRPGDTMTGLARALGTSAAELARSNDMAGPRPLRAGERLRVAPRPSATHRVEPGETLTGLARRFGVSLDELVRWNGMGEPRPLRQGEVLVVSAPAAEPEG